ncbi:MAG: MarR family transcriptional regulator [Alphaproteobacteria bacterium]
MESGANDLIDNFAARLAETAQRWRNTLDVRLGPLGLSQARGLILHHLASHGDGLKQNALADIVGIRGSTLVRQLDRLEADGLVERHNDPDDRRAKTIHLAEKAAPVIVELERHIRDLRRELLSGLTDEQLKTCFGVFDHVQARIDTKREKETGE